MNNLPHTTYKWQLRYGPLALGAFFAGVTLFILFSDVWRGAELTTNHILSLAALVAALASGHMALPYLFSRQIISGVVLCVLSISSTTYVVVSAGSRNADQEQFAERQSKINDTERARFSKMRREAEIILNSCAKGTPKRFRGVRCGLRDAMVRECASGRAKRCEGKSYSVETYTAAIEGYDAKISDLKASKGGKYLYAARALAALPFVHDTPENLETRLKLLMPFVAVLLSEIGTITFLHIGLGRRKLVRKKPNLVHETPVQKPVFDANEYAKPIHEQADELKTSDIQAVIRCLQKQGGQVDKQGDLAVKTGFSKAHVSNMMTHLENKGVVRRDAYKNSKRVVLLLSLRKAMAMA